MDDTLEFNNVFREERGAFSQCRLTFRQQQIIFKNLKTGKPMSVPVEQISSIAWQRFASNHGIRLMMKNGNLHRFDGLRPTDQDKIKQYLERNYKLELETKDLSLKGFNWGSTNFEGEALGFNIDGSGTAFDIPLNAVSDCTSSKNEVILSFHHNDDATVGMTDMRLYMPPGSGEEAIKAFVEKVLSRASVIKVTGQSVATFAELQCLTPRGRYDIKLFPSFIQLHGKTFDYKIPVSTVLRLFQLPHKDGRQSFFVLSLDPPIVQGQTRYQFLQLLFLLEDELTIDLDMDEDELKEKFEGKLTKQLNGSYVNIFANVVKAVTNKRINTPDYKNLTNSAVSCSYKNNNGLLYPLERGFMYVHKPAIHIRFEEISSINFARSDGSTRSFDLEIETKATTTHIFNSIEKEEYPRLYDYVTKKKLRIKNRPTGKVSTTEIADELIDSDDEDAYLARVKNEGRAREQGDEEDSEEEDEDFDPNAAGSDSSSAADSADDSDDFESDDDASDSSSNKRKSSSNKKESTKKAAKTTTSKKPAPSKASTSKASTSKASSKPSVQKTKESSMDDSSQGKFKSREFIDDDDNSSDD